MCAECIALEGCEWITMVMLFPAVDEWIVSLLAEGATNCQLTAELFISYCYVESYGAVHFVCICWDRRRGSAARNRDCVQSEAATTATACLVILCSDCKCRCGSLWRSQSVTCSIISTFQQVGESDHGTPSTSCCNCIAEKVGVNEWYLPSEIEPSIIESSRPKGIKPKRRARKKGRWSRHNTRARCS